MVQGIPAAQNEELALSACESVRGGRYNSMTTFVPREAIRVRSFLARLNSFSSR